MSKHAPGPWGVAPDKQVGCYRLTASDKNGEYRLFAILKLIPDNMNTELADATLIATAPELLEALKQLVDAVDCSSMSNACRSDMARQYNYATRVVAKAEGRNEK